jgi:hypothetical protein
MKAVGIIRESEDTMVDIKVKKREKRKGYGKEVKMNMENIMDHDFNNQ